MAALPANIDLDVLSEALAGAEGMVRFYAGRAKEKAEQNAAMAAAGLKPMHSDLQVAWDESGAARQRKVVACLQAVIDHFGGDAEAQAEAA